MNYTFLRSTILVFLSSAGLCYGAGVLTVDLLRGAAGKSVTFATSVKPTTEPFMALLWTFSGTINIITSTSADIVGQGYEGRIILDKSTGSLVLKNVTEKDSGEYELIIIPYGAEQIQGTAKLEVQTTVSVPTIACPTENPTEGTTSVNLTCDADGSASTRVWMKDGQPLVSGKRFSFYDGNRVLSISPVDRSDAGEFLCNVSNDLSSATAKCQLTVYYGPDRPTISQWPIREELEESVTLICSAASLPKATFFWKFKHMQMNGPVHYIHEMNMMHLGRPAALFYWFLNGDKLSDTGPELTLMNIQMSQSGNYSCQAFNEKTLRYETYQSSVVSVLVPVSTPVVTVSNTDLVEFKDSVRLSCSSSGSSPSFLWLNSSSVVTASDRVQLTDGNSNLTIVNVTRYDQGPFRCRVTNPVSNGNSDPVNLLVISHISNVVITPNSTDLSEFNSSVSLSCSASGSFPSFVWLNDSSEVTLSDRVQLNDRGSILTIIKVTRYDQGPFICHVFNNFSNYTSNPVKLSINFGPENVYLKLSPSQEYFKEGSDINLVCSAESRPAAQIHWFLNGDKLSDTGPELSLTNIQINQSGIYHCQAFNNKTMGYEASKPAAIFVQAPVFDVEMTLNNTYLLEFSSSIRLSCSSDGSSLSFFWLNGSSEVTENDRVQLTDGNSTLTIINVTRHDQGPFRCNVSNGISSEMSQPVNLFVQYGPDNVSIKGPKSVHVGDFTMLYCSTMSVPSAIFTWNFNAKPTSFNEAVYVLPSVRNSDNGTYTCTAVNAVTGQSQTVNHKITVIDLLSPYDTEAED
ncbi:Carcinoembryonic antigen-related cell adhesion molecule 5 Carcinoembryonic antigen [Larimichthys crocea]|uniref:Carcinoembryonic antigen-related cell adhesion molecule 5 Carcinoembryonic antigen n=1 Tax=Larimichthys crocea TaxID=215358 RepID=A0A6G0IC92_LARCR|nr:Carcinoembryonic antigen-related cell adhesion molecule 5 Carcinoembryonic antigen [Larimichthys crocea]